MKKRFLTHYPILRSPGDVNKFRIPGKVSSSPILSTLAAATVKKRFEERLQFLLLLESCQSETFRHLRQMFSSMQNKRLAFTVSSGR